MPVSNISKGKNSKKRPTRLTRGSPTKKRLGKSAKRRGYMVERKIRLAFEDFGWKTIRAGASLGEADLICIKRGKCILLQIKSTKKQKFYYYEYSKPKLEGVPFYLIVDFGYGKIRITPPKKVVGVKDGKSLDDFLGKKNLTPKFITK